MALTNAHWWKFYGLSYTCASYHPLEDGEGCECDEIEDGEGCECDEIAAW